jgi:TonB family protein
MPVLLFLLLFGANPAAEKSDRERDGFKNVVGMVRDEVAPITNDSGKPVEGQRSRKQKIKYDEKGNLTAEVFYQNDRVSNVHFYTPVSRGIREEVAYDRNPPPDRPPSPSQPNTVEERTAFKHTYKYDNNGNQVEEIVTTLEGSPVSKEEWKYNAKGQHIEAQGFDEKGEKTFRGVYAYDAKGMLSTSTLYDSQNKVVAKKTFTYELDAQGNWVKRITSKTLDNGTAEPVEAIYRSITYYPPVGKYLGGVVGGVPKEDGKPAEPDPSIKRVQGSVLTGQATRRVEPVYPRMAMAAKIRGAVVVEVTIDEDGDVLTARALSGHPLLKDSALKAALGWRFTPTELDGSPVSVVGALTFNFNL